MATAQSEQVLAGFNAGAVYGKQRNLWIDAFRRLIRNRLSVIGLVVVVAFIVLAIFAPILGRYHPYSYQNYSLLNKPPSWQHFFGTDPIGHDSWARVLIGLRVSLTVGFSVAAIVLVAAWFASAITEQSQRRREAAVQAGSEARRQADIATHRTDELDSLLGLASSGIFLVPLAAWNWDSPACPFASGTVSGSLLMSRWICWSSSALATAWASFEPYEAQAIKRL